MISKEELRRIAGETGVIPFFVEKEYLQYLFLSSLYGAANGLVFKGAACLRIAYGFERFSRNLEFLSELPPAEVKEAVIKALEHLSTKKIKYRVTSDRLHDRGYDVWLEVEGPLFDEKSKLANHLWIKVTHGSSMLNPKKIKITPPYPGVPGFSVTALGEEEILAEKILSLALEKGPEGAFDAWSMMKHGVSLDLGLMRRKFAEVGEEVSSSMPQLRSKSEYERVISNTVPKLPPYEEVVGELEVYLRNLPTRKLREVVEIKFPRTRDRDFYLAVALFLAMVLVSSYIVIQKGSEDTYTTMYFSNPTQPAVYNSSEGSLTVNFTVENRDGMSVDYTYVLSVYQSETPQTEKNISRRIFLEDDEIAKISENIIADEKTKSAIVSVELYITGRNETYRRIWTRLEDIAGAGDPL